MTKKKDPLKEFSSDELVQELIKRCQNQIELYEATAEQSQAEADELDDVLDQLGKIILE